MNEKEQPVVLEDLQFQIAKLSYELSGQLSIGGAATVDELYDTIQCIHMLAKYCEQTAPLPGPTTKDTEE